MRVRRSTPYFNDFCTRIMYLSSFILSLFAWHFSVFPICMRNLFNILYRQLTQLFVKHLKAIMKDEREGKKRIKRGKKLHTYVLYEITRVHIRVVQMWKKRSENIAVLLSRLFCKICLCKKSNFFHRTSFLSYCNNCDQLSFKLLQRNYDFFSIKFNEFL